MTTKKFFILLDELEMRRAVFTKRLDAIIKVLEKLADELAGK